MIRFDPFGHITPGEVEAYLGTQTGPFSYSEVAATMDPTPGSLADRYDVDRHRFPLGRGRERFERARAALFAWRQFDIPWLELHGNTAAVHTGQVVATVVSVAGFWFVNPCRVVYTELAPEAPNLAAFAYGTLEDHVELGEERFAVVFDPETDEVRYEVDVFSRPAVLLVKLAYPFARRLQKRFVAASAQALIDASSPSPAQSRQY